MRRPSGWFFAYVGKAFVKGRCAAGKPDFNGLKLKAYCLARNPHCPHLRMVYIKRKGGRPGPQARYRQRREINVGSLAEAELQEV